MIISSFMKKGHVDAAKMVFLNMPLKDVVSWNSLISGCVKNFQYEEALRLFKDMCLLGTETDEFTFASVIAACAHLGVLDHALWIHALLIEKNTRLNVILLSAIIDMYAKCGKIEIAKQIFDGSRSNSLSVWNSMITGLAIHGLASEAISTFSHMEERNILPDHITFLGILTACSHCGLVELGKKYFDIMLSQYSVEPELEHYGAMVDLLGRAGHLDEAYATIRAMSRWSSSANMRDMMKREGIHKDHGKSWIELAGILHQFKAGSQSHPEIEAINKILRQLIKRAKLEGYVPSTDLVLMDVSEEEKEENLNLHSEKLALAFGVLKTSPRREIRISKNLRTCSDCHSWFKIVSRMLARVIIVRDRVRFHKFEAALCSCGDCW